MKLKKLIKYLDMVNASVKIWIAEDIEANEDADPMFVGSAMDIPWYLTECKLYNWKDEGTGAIETRVCKNKYGVDVAYMYITVTERED